MNIYQTLKAKINLWRNPPKDGDSRITTITFADGTQEVKAEVWLSARHWRRWDLCAAHFWPRDDQFLNTLEPGSLDYALTLLTAYRQEHASRTVVAEHSVPFV